MKKRDIVLIGFILVIALCSYFYFGMSKAKVGNEAVVIIDGVETEKFSLSVDTEYVIENGNHYNKLVIKDGYAKVLEADCPDKYCVNQKKVNKSGEKIICLPNKVVVEIRGGEESHIDGIAS